MEPFLAGLARRLGRAPLWLDFEGYAARVFAGAPPDWHRDANRFASTLAQAHGLIRSDVVVVPALTSVLHGAAGAPVMEMLSQPGLTAFADDVLASLTHRLGGKAALVLELPSPAALLRRQGKAGPPDFDALDDVAAALIGLVRGLSQWPLAALVLASPGATGPSVDEWEALGPLIKAARYYGWGTVLRADAAPPGSIEPRGGVDTVGARLPAALPARYWLADEETTPPADAFRFGAIPDHAEPERVARRLRELLA